MSPARCGGSLRCSDWRTRRGIGDWVLGRRGQGDTGTRRDREGGKAGGVNVNNDSPLFPPAAPVSCS
ncbi:hypothetical protein QUB80_08215 [Chlorogloeopsis sp. ULAP01]|uniref:hypothetical protein n=1 Tax=Chlorogloeopsis sp. ULAP01 TaxID=3056483 RepID=UPI0025AA7102|nr:hypothetical protein [Chlorogloeopsis sp. ULAP01]MDM9380689.1 hypothetical protein [Chlorogloeopsis sp. ULAP01]